MRQELEWVDWLSIIGSVVSILAFFGISVNLARRYGGSYTGLAVREGWRLIRQPWHTTMLAVATVSTTYLIIWPPESFPASLGLLVPFFAWGLLTAAIFLRQNREVAAALVVGEIERLSRSKSKASPRIVSAVRFDIDRLKAIANYSNATAEDVRDLASRVIKSEAVELTRQGHELAVVDIPGEDETVLIVCGLTVSGLADVADKVRRRIKTELDLLPYYRDAVDLAVSSMRHSPFADEEREGIGTVSAGVAAFRGSPAMLFSDVSSAVKESKVRGRNKTVIYKPGAAPEIRSDYFPPSAGGVGQ